MIALIQAGTYAQIQVSAIGKGIHPDFLPYVFDHFWQEDGATTRKFGGLGLGLAIAAGFQTHLSKPVEPDSIIAVITRLCGWQGEA